MITLSVVLFLICIAFLLFSYRAENTIKLRRAFTALAAVNLVAYVTIQFLLAQNVASALAAIFADLMVIGGVSLLYVVLAKHRTGKWLYAVLIVLALGLWQVPNMLYRFSFHNSTVEAAWDSSAELLIALKSNSHLEDVADLSNAHELTFKRAFFPQQAAITTLDDYYTVDIPYDDHRLVMKVFKQLNAHPAVEWVEGNEMVQVLPETTYVHDIKKDRKWTVNDPDISKQWGLEPLGILKLHQLIRAENIKPRRKARLFILDTGVDGLHEDIKDNYRSHKATYDTDPMGHGSHCAGIAGAVSDNGIGIASLTPDNAFIEISSVKVLSPMGAGTQKTIISGIIEAADSGADVISLSLGGRSSRSRQRAYSQAVSYANRQGAIVVCAAGNSAMDAKDYAPANAGGVITVSAIDKEMRKATFSNDVSNIRMALAAPGVGIRSTIPSNKYADFNGTSMAAPYVSGMVAILKSIDPDLNTRQVFDLLEKTGKKLEDDQSVGVMPQADRAVQKLWKKLH